MAETHTQTDLGVGLAIAFGALALLGAVGTTATSYLYALESDHSMQLLSGVALAITLLCAGLAISVLHLFGE